MKRTPSGFTLIELVVVIFIGSILVAVAISGFQNAQAGYAARNGRVMFETLHALARARSIEMGETLRLIVDATGDSAYILHIDSTVTDVTHFRDDLGVDLVSNPSDFLICMTPRGYADPDCPALPDTAISVPVFLQFKQAGDSATIVVMPMGQLLEL